ncbi:hypothetical protein COL940_013971 [Colletotrichum noveboracense]|nr:hypothetical protein COL940_013971 [Colletotrichum noveboracense]
MARPFAHPRERRASNAESNLESGTPPEKDAFLQTPPTSCDPQLTPDRYVNNFIQALEACRDPPASHPSTAQVELPPQHYDKALRELQRRPSLYRYVQDKCSSYLFGERIDKELQHIARQPDRDGAFAAQAINGGSSRIVVDHAVEESVDREPTSQESVPCTITLQRHPDVRFQHRKAAFPGVLVEAFYSPNGKDLENLTWENIRISTETSKP